MNFIAELEKLIHAEERNVLPLADPFTELARGLHKTGADISLQVEEIYDIVKDANENAKEAKAAKKREDMLTGGLIGVVDLLDAFLLQMPQEHANAALGKLDEILDGCELEPLGFVGDRLNPRLHTVAAARFCEDAPETIIEVAERGYAYRGKVVRKATVILSKGVENA